MENKQDIIDDQTANVADGKGSDQPINYTSLQIGQDQSDQEGDKQDEQCCKPQVAHQKIDNIAMADRKCESSNIQEPAGQNQNIQSITSPREQLQSNLKKLEIPISDSQQQPVSGESNSFDKEQSSDPNENKPVMVSKDLSPLSPNKFTPDEDFNSQANTFKIQLKDNNDCVNETRSGEVTQQQNDKIDKQFPLQRNMTSNFSRQSQKITIQNNIKGDISNNTNANSSKINKNIDQLPIYDIYKLQSELEQSNQDQNNVETKEEEKKRYIPANPILPKMHHMTMQKPPECPLKDIQFIQLKQFKRYQQKQYKMGDGFDQIGKKNMMRANREKRRAQEEKHRESKRYDPDEIEAKMDEYTHIIQNIVYARDPKIFDTKNGLVNQRAAFMHENLLDIKNLIRMNELRDPNIERIGNRVPPPKIKPPKTKQQIEYEKELEAKARYKLRETPEGEIDRNDKTLLFESRFESGNLYIAQKVSDYEYNLLMQNDINTSGHTQWFFFQVKNTRKNMAVKFNIMNFTKQDSIFNYGMKVSVYSEIKAEQNEANLEVNEGAVNGEKKSTNSGISEGWHKGGENISYYANGIKKEISYYSRGYYTVSFTYKFQHDDDTVFFAYCYPYTYTDLQNDLNEIESDPLRVHPGEVVGSWMMRGVINFLTDPENNEAKMLREKYIFKVIPMLNPDGVINGNYRCSLAGCDLNRRWKFPSKSIHPTIFQTKRLIRDLHRERGLLLYCDLHGHSRKQNVFMYGCNNRQRPEECRVFPLILSKLSKFFHFGSCRFGVQKSKESTARVCLYKELKSCPNIFTMESTFSGIDFGELSGQHMTTQQFEQMGIDLCRCILIYDNVYVPPELEHLFGKKNKNEKEKFNNMTDIFEKELLCNKKLLAAGDGDSSGGSDSEPSEDNLPVDEVAKVVPIVDKAQKLQLQKLLKKKAQDEKDKEKQPPKKRLESPARSQQTRQKSPTKKQNEEIIKVKPTIEKKDEKKKKPEMKDAWTQTERSDYQRIKRQQEQARMMKEMKEQQARLRAQQAQQQIKSSPGELIQCGQTKKTHPQSQTKQRGDGLGFDQSINPISYNQERRLQDIREQQKLQISQDRYSLFKANNNLSGMTSPNNLKPTDNSQATQQLMVVNPALNPSYNISNFNQVNTMGQQALVPLSHLQQQQQLQQYRNINRQANNQNPQGGSMANPQLNLNGVPGLVQGSSSPNKQRQYQGINNKFGFERAQDAPLDLINRQNENMIRGAGSTISKAGEQIMRNQNYQQNMNIHSGSTPIVNPVNSQSPVKNQRNNPNGNVNNSDLRLQIHQITSNHFGNGLGQYKDSVPSVTLPNQNQSNYNTQISSSANGISMKQSMYGGASGVLESNNTRSGRLNAAGLQAAMGTTAQMSKTKKQGGFGTTQPSINPGSATKDVYKSFEMSYQNLNQGSTNSHGMTQILQHNMNVQLSDVIDPKQNTKFLQNDNNQGPQIQIMRRGSQYREQNQSQIEQSSRNLNEMEKFKLFKTANGSGQPVNTEQNQQYKDHLLSQNTQNSVQIYNQRHANMANQRHSGVESNKEKQSLKLLQQQQKLGHMISNKSHQAPMSSSQQKNVSRRQRFENASNSGQANNFTNQQLKVNQMNQQFIVSNTHPITQQDLKNQSVGNSQHLVSQQSPNNINTILNSGMKQQPDLSAVLQNQNNYINKNQTGPQSMNYTNQLINTAKINKQNGQHQHNGSNSASISNPITPQNESNNKNQRVVMMNSTNQQGKFDPNMG